MSAPSVLLMARAPRRGDARQALEPLLGAARCAALQAWLIVQACRWGRAVAPGAVHLAHDPADAAPELRGLLGEDIALFPQHGDGLAERLADATARVFSRRSGPLLIAWPDLARLRPDHGRAALEDLRAGCDVVLGPIIGGGFYLMAISRPLPRLFVLSEHAWRGPDVMALGLGAAQQAGLEVGILRTERALRRPADVRAALADPLLQAELAELLGTG